MLSHDHLAVYFCFAAYFQVFNRDNTSSSFSKGVVISLSISMKLPLASSSKPDANETLPSQLPPQWMRHNYHLLAVFCRDARNRQLIWKLAKQSEAHLGRLIVLEEWANAQREIANILNRESVLARNGLAATVEGAVGALQQFNECLEHSLNPGRF